MGFDRVLVAVDLSLASRTTVERALQLVAPEGTLTVLHVSSRWPRRAHPSAALEALVRRFEPVAANIEIEMRVGRAANEILEVAERDGADLCVIEKGRAAVQVANAARVPALVVAPDALEAKRVLLALEFSTASFKAAAAGVEVGARLGVPVAALHVIDPRAPGSRDRVLEDARQGIESLVRLATNTAVPVGLRIGSVVDELVSAAEPTDLLVCGARRASFLERLTAPSVSAALLRHARGSVLVVPPPLGEARPAPTRRRERKRELVAARP